MIRAAGDLSAEVTLIVKLNGNPFVRINPFCDFGRLLFMTLFSALNHGSFLCGPVSVFRFHLGNHTRADHGTPNRGAERKQSPNGNKPGH